MFNMNFSNDYKVVHICNELGNHVTTYAGIHMNQLYKNRDKYTGFVYMNVNSSNQDFSLSDFAEPKDILIMNKDESCKLQDIFCDILVVHSYEFTSGIEDKYVKNKKLVYVVHSIPAIDLVQDRNASKECQDIKQKFEALCEMSSIIVCVSYAEKKRLSKMYPQWKEKIIVIYDGMELPSKIVLNLGYRTSRRRLGYIGEISYSNGILECVKALKEIRAELHISCSIGDKDCLKEMLMYIDKENMHDKIHFYGRCTNERKKIFLNSLDALIVPALYEPFGYTILEGVDAGLPIISSNGGALDEVLEGYKYKYNPSDRHALNVCMETFLRDKSEQIFEQQKKLLYNRMKFTAQRMVMEYAEMFRYL